MLSDSKVNFKASYKNNLWCSVCYLFPETQQHLFDCFVLRSKLKNEVNFEEFQYDYIDGTTSEQEKFAQLCTKILKLRRELLSKNQDDSSQSEVQSTEDPDDSMNQLF